MNVLFICSVNKDRSATAEGYARENYSEHEFESATISNYSITNINPLPSNLDLFLYY